ncbi:MAG: recombinase family protein [Planctomycetes bacterium]|nr:recombinase family protein [Planctomycetota bacterium]
MSDSSTPEVAYSYIRFSSKKQADGDSLRRQTEAAAAWCERNKVRLDTSTTLHDLGKSAYLGEHRKNPDRYALAAFLKLVERGKVPRGSYLLVENLDRLTREHVRPAVTLFLSILDQGVSIVTTSPERVFRHDSDDMTDVIIAVVELSRGHGESARKSGLLGSVWAEKKACAQRGEAQPARHNSTVAGSRLLTHCLPTWVEEVGGKPVLIPSRAAVVKQIFALARGGYGYHRIVAKLTEDGVPPFGTAKHWSRSTVVNIVRDRRAVGEYQPCKRVGKNKRIKDGPPIPGYYPAVVSEDDWNAAQGARGRKRGRVGKHIHLFDRGMIRDARDGGTYLPATKTDNGKHTRALIPTASLEGRGKCVSFPLATFEAAVLSKLREIDPHEILNGDSGPDESLTLAGELARVEASLALISQEMDDHGESPTLFKRLRAKEEEYRDLDRRLTEAQQKAIYPLSDAWGETQSLIAALNSAPDPADARLRLRSALSRIVESIWLLVVPCGRDRLCACQVWFQGGERQRSYVILHRSPRGNRHGRREGSWSVRSFADVAGPDDLDLRNREHAAKLEKALAALDFPPRFQE